MAEVNDNWMRQARKDYEAAEANLETGQYFVCVFLCQQCAEKALKAVVLKKTWELIKTHDLKFLAKKAGASTDMQMKTAYLSPYFVETRYPDYDDEIPAETYDEKEAKEALKLAKEILEWVEKND